jgi:hypothetical protein
VGSRRRPTQSGRTTYPRIANFDNWTLAGGGLPLTLMSMSRISVSSFRTKGPISRSAPEPAAPTLSEHPADSPSCEPIHSVLDLDQHQPIGRGAFAVAPGFCRFDRSSGLMTSDLSGIVWCQPLNNWSRCDREVGPLTGVWNLSVHPEGTGSSTVGPKVPRSPDVWSETPPGAGSASKTHETGASLVTRLSWASARQTIERTRRCGPPV